MGEKAKFFISLLIFGAGVIVSSIFITPFGIWVVTFQAIAFVLIMYGVYRLLDFIPNFSLRIKYYFLVESVKNLYILPFLRRRKNEYNLIFFPTEWRYPFNKRLIYPSVPSFGENILLIWRNSSSENVKMWRFSEIKFVEVDTKNNEFSIRTNQGKSGAYKLGNYPFKVLVTCNILTNKGPRVVWREFYVVINFKGGRKIGISVK